MNVKNSRDVYGDINIKKTHEYPNYVVPVYANTPNLYILCPRMVYIMKGCSYFGVLNSALGPAGGYRYLLARLKIKLRLVDNLLTCLLCCLSHYEKETLIWEVLNNLQRRKDMKESKSNKGEEKYVFKFLFWYVILYFKLHHITFLKVPKTKFPPILQLIHLFWVGVLFHMGNWWHICSHMLVLDKTCE